MISWLGMNIGYTMMSRMSGSDSMGAFVGLMALDGLLIVIPSVVVIRLCGRGPSLSRLIIARIVVLAMIAAVSLSSILLAINRQGHGQSSLTVVVLVLILAQNLLERRERASWRGP